jgi:hypothetical protein
MNAPEQTLLRGLLLAIEYESNAAIEGTNASEGEYETALEDVHCLACVATLLLSGVRAENISERFRRAAEFALQRSGVSAQEISNG